MFGWFKSKKHPPPKHPSPPVREDYHDPKKVLDLFTGLTGIHFKHKEPIVTSKLIHFSRSRSIVSFDDLLQQIQSGPALLQELINHLTVNETYFFREVKQIDYMASIAAAEKRPIRILCAPGSTGEEPYSIAITLLEHDIPPERIEIVSIDINSEAIEAAEKALYTHRALHKTPISIEERYFVHENDRIRVSDQIKKRVMFQVFNIFDSNLSSLGKFDFIFSRNMLIYFEPVIANQAIKNLQKLARSKETLFFFGHADIVSPPLSMQEHYEDGIRFFTLLS